MGYVLLLIVIVIIYYGFKNRRDNKILDLLPEQFVVFDLETTGPDAKKHEVIELAAMRVSREYSTTVTFQTLVKPQTNIQQAIVGLTGITQEMLDSDGALLADALERFGEFVGDARLVSFDAKLKKAFLNAAIARCNMAPLRNPVSCALKMARRAWPNRKSYRLAEIASDEQVKVDGEHRVLENCRRTLAVYEAAAFKLKSVR